MNSQTVSCLGRRRRIQCHPWSAQVLRHEYSGHHSVCGQRSRKTDEAEFIEMTFWNNGADYFAKNIKVEPDGTRFDAVFCGKELKDLSIRLVGRHNVYAALFAIAVA